METQVKELVALDELTVAQVTEPGIVQVTQEDLMGGVGTVILTRDDLHNLLTALG